MPFIKPHKRPATLGRQTFSSYKTKKNKTVQGCHFSLQERKSSGLYAISERAACRIVLADEAWTIVYEIATGDGIERLADEWKYITNALERQIETECEAFSNLTDVKQLLWLRAHFQSKSSEASNSDTQEEPTTDDSDRTKTLGKRANPTPRTRTRKQRTLSLSLPPPTKIWNQPFSLHLRGWKSFLYLLVVSNVAFSLLQNMSPWNAWLTQLLGSFVLACCVLLGDPFSITLTLARPGAVVLPPEEVGTPPIPDFGEDFEDLNSDCPDSFRNGLRARPWSVPSSVYSCLYSTCLCLM
jgi:hypothetical protein